MNMLIRDAKGKKYNEVNEPTAVYNSKLGTLYKIGEREEMEKYFSFLQKTYREGGFPEEANEVALMVLPKDQELIDRVFQTIDYMLVLHKEFTTQTTNESKE